MKKKRYQLSFLVRWAGKLGCVLALTLFVLGRMALAQGIYEDDVREAADIKDIEEELFGVEDQGFILQDQYQHTPKLTGYTCNLKRLLDKIEDNIRSVDEKIQGKGIQKPDEVRAFLEKKMRPMYTQALSLYQARYYQISLDMFKEINEVLANYKATNYYIDYIPHVIEQEKQRWDSDHQKFVQTLFR